MHSGASVFVFNTFHISTHTHFIFSLECMARSYKIIFSSEEKATSHHKIKPGLSQQLLGVGEGDRETSLLRIKEDT